MMTMVRSIKTVLSREVLAYHIVVVNNQVSMRTSVIVIMMSASYGASMSANDLISVVFSLFFDFVLVFIGSVRLAITAHFVELRSMAVDAAMVEVHFERLVKLMLDFHVLEAGTFRLHLQDQMTSAREHVLRMED